MWSNDIQGKMHWVVTDVSGGTFAYRLKVGWISAFAGMTKEKMEGQKNIDSTDDEFYSAGRQYE
ncbi:MAG: hypothetical protein PHV34_09970 [Verrucomicrobiae bacterium]|nr:hypothetical protein [Verrucomicrobiae bacterium]